jgi:TRAP-type C4-dicarboxylate transport system permease large subunit
VKAKLDPSSAPVVKETITWKERFRALPQVWGITVIFGTIFVGLFTGIFTSSESAAFGAFAALVLLVIRTRKGLTKKFIGACVDSAEVTVGLFFLMLGAYVFSNFLIIAGLPQAIAATVVGSGWPPMVILLGMILTYFVLGMFMDGVTITFLTIPIYFPIVQQLGFDGIWFGVIVVAMVEIGLVSPPFGMVAYAIKTIMPETDLVSIFRGTMMFMFLELAVVVLLLFFPQIALWLPSLMK